MKISKESIGLNKIYRRRDNYDLQPEYQRPEDIWSEEKEQRLLDSILKKWTIPKIIFRKIEEDSFECVDGQQRLNAIFKFFGSELPLAKKFSGSYGDLYYSDLPSNVKDIFDDFELDTEIILEATEEELRELFTRLQLGAALNSAERLNTKLGNMRDFIKKLSNHPFLSDVTPLKDTRYAFQAICAQICLLEKDGIRNAKLQDLVNFYDREKEFDSNSKKGQKIAKILNEMYELFKVKTSLFRNRASIISFYLLLSEIFDKTGGNIEKYKEKLKSFYSEFNKQLKEEIAKGAEGNPELIFYQSKVNQAADSKDSIKKRHEILKRRSVIFDGSLKKVFGEELDLDLIEIYKKEDIRKISDSIISILTQINKIYSTKNKEDLFKPTTELIGSIGKVSSPISSKRDFKELIDSLYKIFYEGSGSLVRIPQKLIGEESIFIEIKNLRTDCFHDYEHGVDGKILKKKEEISKVYEKYSGKKTIEEIEEINLIHFQRKLLEKIRNSLIELLKDISF